MVERIGWIDASMGVSGDMLLGALVGAGVPLEVLQQSIDAVAPEPITLRAETVRRNGIAATKVHVECESSTSRTWADLRDLLTGRPRDVFERLAVAEAAVHGVTPEEVHFHEVGALDAIADVVGACAGLEHLGLDRLLVSAVALGGGTVRTEHGRLPVPAPAVVELLRGRPSYGGPVDLELATPTGAALVATLAEPSPQQPSMSVDVIGVGAGSKDPAGHANVLRLLVGESVARSRTCECGAGDAREPHATQERHSHAPVRRHEALVIEANVDDLDPRLWPDVIAVLLDAGASDAWLSPILMKKGRPAHTLHVLVDEERAEKVREAVFRHTSTIGVREQAFTKHALDREVHQVQVDGQVIAVKVARLDGEVVNVQPEYEEVRRAAVVLRKPVAEVLAAANQAARNVSPWNSPSSP